MSYDLFTSEDFPSQLRERSGDLGMVTVVVRSDENLLYGAGDSEQIKKLKTGEQSSSTPALSQLRVCHMGSMLELSGEFSQLGVTEIGSDRSPSRPNLVFPFSGVLSNFGPSRFEFIPTVPRV